MHCSHGKFEIYKYRSVFGFFFFIVILVLFAGSICVILLDRNFSIIAHVDHKSTLADKILELIGTIKRGHGQPQYLDKLQVY